MESEIKAMRNDIKQLTIDIALIKNTLLDEGELSDWAKRELAEARAEPEDKMLSSEQVRELIISK